MILMLDQLRSLAIFAKVAEVGSFRAAATALGITPPVVSQHVSQLEADLELALVYRTTRTLRLTDAGEKLALAARNMLDAAETGLDAITDDNAPPHGKLAIAAPGISDYAPFLDGLTRYVRQFPDVDLTVSFDDKIRDLIREGFDLGIRAGTALNDSSLKSRKLMDNPLVLACSPGYVGERGKVGHPSELAERGYQWVGGPIRSKTTMLRRKDDPKVTCEIPVSTTINVDTYKASINLGMRGNGLVKISTMDLTEEFENGLLVEPLPEWEPESMSIYAVWPANAGSRSLTRHVLNFLLEEIASGIAAKTAKKEKAGL
jgi:DNA-binding transcriptional LysR family regulator